MATEPREPPAQGACGASRRENPRVSTRQARTRAEPRASPLFCVRACKAAFGREFGDKYSAEPSRPPPPPRSRPGGGVREGRGPGAGVLPAAHQPANLERCGRSRLGRPAGAAGLAARPLAGTAPGRPSSPALGNNEVQAGAAPAAGAFAVGVRAGVRLAARAGRGRKGHHCLGLGATRVAGEAGASSPAAFHLGGMDGGEAETRASLRNPGSRGARPR